MLARAAAAAASARGSPRRRARARCRRPRCSRSRASSASTRARASRGPARALAAGARWARERGGAVLATGSVYLVGELLAQLGASTARRWPRERAPGARPMNDEGPSVLDDDRRRGADRGAGDPRILRRWLRVRPAVSLNSGRPMLTSRLLRNRKQRPEPGHRPADPVRRRPVPVADLLDLRGRAPADPRSDAGRLRRRPRRCSRSWARSSTWSCARPSTSRTCASASSRCRPPRRACTSSSSTLCPHCDYRDRARLRPLPELPAQAQGALRELLASARPGMDDLSLLRGRGARASRSPRARRRRDATALERRAARACRAARSAVEPSDRAGQAEDPRAAGDPSVARQRRRAAAPPRRRRAPAPDAPERHLERKEAMDRTLILVKPDAFAARPDRRDNRPLRAQGAADRRAAAHDGHARARRAPLRRARRAPVLRRARRVHHLGPDRRDGARGRRRGQGRPPGDRRDRSAGGRARARSAATSRSRWAPTWCTARTRRSPPRARRRCSSRTSSRSCPSARPLVLASRSPQRRAMLERLGVRFTVGAPASRSSSRAIPSRWRVENALRKARAVRRARRARGACIGCDTIVALDGDIYGKPRRRRARRAQTLRRARRAARHEVLSGARRCCSRATELHARSRAPTSRFRELDERAARLVRRHRRVARARGRLRDPGRGRRARARACEGDYENVVGLPLATLLDLYPELLRR